LRAVWSKDIASAGFALTKGLDQKFAVFILFLIIPNRPMLDIKARHKVTQPLRMHHQFFYFWALTSSQFAWGAPAPPHPQSQPLPTCRGGWGPGRGFITANKFVLSGNATGVCISRNTDF
jgi:hypothetical protein